MLLMNLVYKLLTNGVKFNYLLMVPLLMASLQAATVADLTFALNGASNGYTVTDCNVSASGSLDIPSVYNGLPVTSTGREALAYCSSLTSISIPDSVTSIGARTFRGCTNLTSITIGDGVTSIGDNAFAFCSGLISVTIPDSVTSIGYDAFGSCTSLGSITFEGDAPTFGTYVFSGSNSVTVYYYSTKSGWSNTVAGRTAVEINVPLLNAITERDAAIAERDAAILERDAAIAERDALPTQASYDAVVAERDARPTQEAYDAVVAERDARFTPEAYEELAAELGARPTQEAYDVVVAARDARPTQEAYDAVVAARDARPTLEAYDLVVAERDARLTESEVRDLKLGSSMLEVVEGEASINIELEATDNLGITSPTWTPVPKSKVVIHPEFQNGKIKIDVKADDESNSGVRFFRFKMNDSDSSNKAINLSIGESEYDETAIIEALAEQYQVPVDSISLDITSG